MTVMISTLTYFGIVLSANSRRTYRNITAVFDMEYVDAILEIVSNNNSYYLQ